MFTFTFTPAALHGPLLCVGPMGRQVSAAAETLRSKLAEVEPEVRGPRVCSLMLDALPPHAKVPVGGMCDTWISGRDVYSFCCYVFWIPGSVSEA
jgi:hypothetical protein